MIEFSLVSPALWSTLTYLWDGLTWNFVQRFLVHRRILQTFVIDPMTLPLALSEQLLDGLPWHLSLVSTKQSGPVQFAAHLSSYLRVSILKSCGWYHRTTSSCFIYLSAGLCASIRMNCNILIPFYLAPLSVQIIHITLNKYQMMIFLSSWLYFLLVLISKG